MESGKKFGCGCIVMAAFASGMLLVPMLLIGGLMCGLSAVTSGKGLSADADAYGETKPEWDKPLNKKWVWGDGSEDDPQVVSITLRGVIAPTEEGGQSLLRGGESHYEQVLRGIRAATRDDKVRGICLTLDTPGGTVTEADILANALARFKASRKGRFVMAHMGGMCCSGGYYVASGADYIMAHPTTLTGSIGVIMSGYNAAELAKKAGVKSVVIASGDNKALLDPLEPVNPEHVKILQRPVGQDYERFVSLVAKGRNLKVEEVREVADGRVLSAADAQRAKLVDGLGYAEDAWAKARELAKAKKIRIYRYEESFSWRSLLSSDAFSKCGEAFARGILSAVGADSMRTEYRVK